MILASSEAVVEVSEDHKAVQAMCVDSHGTRAVTGSIDGILQYWDFHGMNGVAPKPFRELIPVEGHSINSLSFNSTGGLVLCVTSDSKARIFDREGTTRPVEETLKGDQYIRTPENTKGHTHNLTYGEFHPTDSTRFMTCSYDSTVRLWDLNTKKVGMDQNIPNLNCFKCVDQRGICGGNRLFVSTAAYNSDGKQVMAGCSDGSLHLFQEKNRYGKGLQVIRSAHNGSEVTGINFCFDDTQLVSRGMDDTIKFWDMRKLTDPVRTWTGIETVRPLSNMAFSPRSEWLIAGTATGEIACIDMESGDVAGRKKLMTRQVVRVAWHPLLNQIFSSCVDGNWFIEYDDQESTGGALSFVHKTAPIRKEAASTQPSLTEVFSYEELIESGKYRENRQGEIKEVFERPGRRQQDTIVQNIIPSHRPEKQVDIQQQLLSYGSEGTGLISGAYRDTQPEAVLDFSESAANQSADTLLRKKQYCPRCGLKICTCGYLGGEQPRASQEGPLVSSKKQKM